MEKIEFKESKIDELKALLESHDVDTSTWGQGATKTIEHLQKASLGPKATKKFKMTKQHTLYGKN